jgi:lysophospholipase L1-like esterase
MHVLFLFFRNSHNKQSKMKNNRKQQSQQPKQQQQQQPKQQRTTTAVYKQRTADTNEKHIAYFETVGKGTEILLLGDSMLERWQTTGREIWRNKGLNRRKIGNAGVGGDRTEHVLYRIDHGLLNTIKPKLVILLIGTNNIEKDSEQDVRDGIQKIIDQVRLKVSGDVKFVVYGVLPRQGTDTLKRKIDNLNVLIRDTIPNIQYEYFGDKFVNAKGEWQSSFFDDNVHLNTTGYELFGDVLLSTIASSGLV